MATPIFPKPSTIFIGVGTDYNAAEVIVKEMSSYIRSQAGCNCYSSLESKLNNIDFTLTCMDYDSAAVLNNTSRWQVDVEVAYRLLYPLT